MKGCPICNKKYQDDTLKCENCDIELMDWKIAENIYNYGYDRIKDKNSKEYQIILEYRRKNGINNTYKNISDINKNNTPQSKVIKHHPQTSQQNIPKCPICQSTNLSKITNTRKAGKIALFGIFGAGDLGKTWKCNKCGSKF